MPHKHRRDKSKNGPSYDLPPTSLAHPLPVTKAPPSASTSKPSGPRSGKRHLKSAAADDTPRGFTRLMAYTLTGRKLPSGLDDGIRPSKKRKRPATSSDPSPLRSPSDTTLIPTFTTPDIPKIHPSEPLSAFSARVDAALPVSGLISKHKVKIEGEKPRQTRTEKKMQRMQREWREEERRRQEAREAESDEEFDGDGVVGAGTVGTKKGKKTRHGDYVDEGDDDWAAITSKRTLTTTTTTNTDTPKSSFGIKGLVGLHDVVLAPPKLVRVREKMKAFGGVGSGTGGLKRQGELSEARARVVDGYRALMKERRWVGVSYGGAYVEDD